jgi:hypothetical protein
MNPVLGWTLAAAAFVGGYFSYGWPGLAMAFSAVVFWLLLQFSRSVRVLRMAGNRPVGTVASAVMLHSKLKAGMRLPEVLVLTRSLGRRVEGDAASPRETWAWTDTGGDTVQLTLVDGRLTQWELQRAAA